MKKFKELLSQKRYFKPRNFNVGSIALTAALALSVSACSKDKGNQNREEAPFVKTSTIVGSDGKRIGEITQKPYSPNTILELQKKSLQETAIDKAEVDPQYNANLYVIRGAISKNLLRLAPRIMVLPSNTLNPFVENEDGTYTVNMNVALVDGLETKIHNPATTDGSINVPQHLLVKDLSGLKNVIRQKYNSADIAPIENCPSAISITIAGEAYDVTPEPLRNKNLCASVNTPFSVSLRLSRQKAEDLFVKLLPNGAASIYADYALAVPTTIGRVSISFDKAKLFDDLRANLHASYDVYAQTDIQLAIKNILERSNLDVTVVGNVGDITSQILPSVLNTFFKKFEEPPTVAGAPDCRAIACFHLSYVQSTEKDTLNIAYDSLATTRTNVIFTTVAALTEAGRIPTILGKDRIFSNVKSKDLEQDKMINTGLSASQGTIINFMPTKIMIEKRARPSEVVQNQETWNVCDSRIYYPGGSTCTHTSSRNRTYYTSEYSPAMWAANDKDSALQFINSNDLKFVFTLNSGRIVKCSLANLDVDMNGASALVVLKNTPYCSIFMPNENKVANIALVNETRLPVETYTSGVRCAGDECGPSTYSQVSFEPEMRIEAEISMYAGIAGGNSSTEFKR